MSLTCSSTFAKAKVVIYLVIHSTQSGSTSYLEVIVDIMTARHSSNDDSYRL